MNKLFITHNAGFFSCSSIALQDIMIYFNQHYGLPDEVNRATQYSLYKTQATDDLIPFYFSETDTSIQYHGEVAIIRVVENVPQFSNYARICFDDIKPFIDKFFMPSAYVSTILQNYENKYSIDYENTCAVFYRGNDKSKETTIAPYTEFINKAKEIENTNLGIRFLVQTDETEFLNAFTAVFPNSIHFAEVPHMKKNDSAVLYKMAQPVRCEFGAKFLAATLSVSKCRYLITHSGNCGIWAVFYRGNMNNVYQILNNKWV